jgi:PPM family protein phosphatase
MDNQIKVNVSSVSHAGTGYSENDDNFYINGRYRYEYEMENIQVTTDCISNDHIFAVSDGLDRAATEKRPSISMVKELKKFQDQLNVKNGDFNSRVSLIKEKLEETNNIIYSMFLNDISRNPLIGEKETSFGSIFISEGKAVALNIGKSRAYLFRDGVFKQLTGDLKKSDKLLKMGIITNDQANILTGKFGIPMEDLKIGIQKSEVINVKTGDLFMLCTDGLINVLDEEKISEIVSIHKETGLISGMLVKEALKYGSKDNITVLVIKVEMNNSLEKTKTSNDDFPTKRVASRGNKKSHKSLILITAAIIVLIAGATVLGVKMNLIPINFKDPGPPLVSDNTALTADDQDHSNVDTTSGIEDTQTNSTDTDALESDTDDSNLERYTVKEGDSLQKISKMYYGDPEKYDIIMEKNKITNPNQIQIGQVLIIP